MTERDVSINVTKALRDVIQNLKKELTYDQFLSELVKKTPEPFDSGMKIPKRSIKGAKLN
ncbi:MAG: hypothetical protein H8D35_07885 [Nitrosopumilus sp.]|nr:hypothetical protein [Nitrosopumilus sp.]